ncbi:MAG: winged helix-turn-helix transcriptional regulator [Anaerolineae bacterium]
MSAIIRANLNDPDCVSRKMLDFLGNKWGAHVMYELAAEPLRYNELKRRVQGISFKMLTKTLRLLEENKLVHREDYGTIPPHVDYRLTPLGASLLAELIRLVEWGFEHADELGW